MNPEEKKGEDGKIIAPVIEEKKPEPSQNPIKTELERVGKIPKSKSAQIRFNIQRMQKDLEEAEKNEGGGSAPSALEDEDRDKTVTVGMLKDIEKRNAQATALQMAASIADEDERALTVHYLQTRIVSSGNPSEDFRLAQSLVNSLKNQQVAEEIVRKSNNGKPAPTGTGTGAPAKPPEDEFVPTEVERSMMRAPFNLSKDEVIKARRTAAELGQ